MIVSTCHEEVTIMGVALKIGFNYQPYQPITWTEPPVPEDYEINEVMAGDVNIIALLDDSVIGLIIDALKKIKKERENQDD